MGVIDVNTQWDWQTNRHRTTTLAMGTGTTEAIKLLWPKTNVWKLPGTGAYLHSLEKKSSGTFSIRKCFYDTHFGCWILSLTFVLPVPDILFFMLTLQLCSVHSWSDTFLFSPGRELIIMALFRIPWNSWRGSVTRGRGKGELLFSSVGPVKLIHGHWLRSLSKMHHILSQYRFEGIFGFVCAKFSKNYL